MIDIGDIKKVEFGITSLCNAGCPLCQRHYPGTSRVRQTLELGSTTYNKFIQVSRQFGKKIFEIEAIFCGSWGDPIAAPDIYKILKYATKKYKKVHLDTNGSIRDERFWKKVAKLNNLLITFSIDGMEDTNQYYRINTDWNTIMRNATTYINAGGRAEWKFIKFEHNEHQVDEAKRLAMYLGFERFQTVNSHRFKDDVLHIEPEAYSKAINKVGKNGFTLRPTKDLNTKKQWKNVTDTKQVVSCKTLNEGYLYVDHNFKLWPCCFFSSGEGTPHFREYGSIIQMAYGSDFNSLHKHKLETILNHRYFREYLPNSWTDDNLVSCKQCYKKCGKRGYSHDNKKIKLF